MSNRLRQLAEEMGRSRYPIRVQRRRRRRSPSTPTASQSATADEEEEEEDENDADVSVSKHWRSDSHDAENSSLKEVTDIESASYSYSLSSGSAAAPPPRQTLATPANYVNAAPLPIFRGGGDECPVAHLRRFARVCVANNAPAPETMARLFPVTLDGEAALWYELQIEPRPELSWEELKISFLRAYCSPELQEQCRSELMAMKQAEDETVNAYFLRLQWILRKWPAHGIPDGILRGIFVDGLKENFQDWIVPQRPETLEEAFRLALSWEQAQRTREFRRKELKKCGFCDGEHEEGSCEVRRGMRELWLRSKEKAQRLKLSSPASPGRLRSLSLSARMGREWGERKDEEGVEMGKSQCQCGKKSDRGAGGTLTEGNASPNTD